SVAAALSPGTVPRRAGTGSATETVAVPAGATQDGRDTEAAGPPPARPGELSPGTVVLGYTVERELGRGAMGVVLLARRGAEPRVALKLMTKAGTEELKRRFLREGRALMRLQHPSIVSARDAGEKNGVPYLAMEYVEGKSLTKTAKEGL